jgi:hypothetical protein
MIMPHGFPAGLCTKNYLVQANTLIDRRPRSAPHKWCTIRVSQY